MLKVIGFGFLGLFVLMIFPSTITDGADSMFYGTANMVLSDSDGNVLLTQTVHNQITDEGEAFIVDQVFDTATAAETGDARAGAVCISGAADSAFSETTTAALATGLTAGNHCHSTAVVNTGVSTATTDGEMFTAGVDFGSGETISGILICVKGTNGDANFAECNTGTPAVALAALDLNNVTVSGSDTITITYTFNITTSTT